MYYIDPDNYFREDLDNREVIVSIKCFTYNHEKYIADALEGFVMQKTNFRFEAIVHDDASTDGTAAIIREYAEKYPSIIKPIFETENQYSKKDGSLRRIMNDHVRGRYVAYCEGDDYWTDPLKLQKQVDFLESHPDYTITCCKYNIYNQKEQQVYYCNHKDTNRDITFNDLILHNYIATLTVLIRAEIYLGYRDFIKEAPIWSFGDYPLWLYASTKGKIMKFPEEMAMYRILENSASHMTNDQSRLKWAYSEFSMFDYFDSRFNIPKSVRREALFNRCVACERLAIKANDDYLIKRIKTVYKIFPFPFAWLSFNLKLKYPRLHPIYNFIDSHHSIKAPFLYIKRKLKN